MDGSDGSEIDEQPEIHARKIKTEIMDRFGMGGTSFEISLDNIGRDGTESSFIEGKTPGAQVLSRRDE
jgi:hypothetical protein